MDRLFVHVLPGQPTRSAAPASPVMPARPLAPPFVSLVTLCASVCLEVRWCLSMLTIGGAGFGERRPRATHWFVCGTHAIGLPDRHRVWVEANSEKAAEFFMLAADQARVCARPSAHVAMRLLLRGRFRLSTSRRCCQERRERSQMAGASACVQPGLYVTCCPLSSACPVLATRSQSARRHVCVALLLGQSAPSLALTMLGLDLSCCCTPSGCCAELCVERCCSASAGGLVA